MDSKPASGMVRFFSAVAFKCQVLVRSLMAFVLMSTVTAMTVRTLLSSGVVIMFPMVMLMERMGLHGVDMHVSSLCVCVCVCVCGLIPEKTAVDNRGRIKRANAPVLRRTFQREKQNQQSMSSCVRWLFRETSC